MKNLNKILFTLLCIAGSFGAYADHLSSNLLVSAKLTGDQEVPAVTTDAVGVASFTINGDRDEICFNVSVNGLSGEITGAHLHEGELGANGSVDLDLTSYIQGNRIIGSLTGTDITDARIKKLLSGNLYLNIHTAANPNGEIRGQLSLEADFAYVSILSGANEVPPVAVPATGAGVFRLAKHKGELNIRVVVEGLSGAITGAHFHSGAKGTNGGVVENLTTMVNGNVIEGSVDPTAYLADLEAGNIYINIHTAANAGGEIRAQLDAQRGLVFDALMDTTQETGPVVMGNPNGIATLVLSPTFDTLTVGFQVEGKTDTINGAHLHTGAAGTDGGVLLDFSPFVNGNVALGEITGAALTDAIIIDLLTGNSYLNLHTKNNPAGELRGQVIRFAREGYAVNIDNKQEVPATTSTAVGGGMITVDRDQTNAHIMIVYSGLSGANGGVHLHSNVAGQNGSVVFNLTPFTQQDDGDDEMFLYWKSTDASPFTTANSLQLRRDSIYVNIHSAAEPNGEIRGQALRGGACYEAPVGINTFSGIPSLNIYPNPSVDILSVQGMASSNYDWKIMDIAGKTVKVGNTNGNTTLNVSELNQGVYFLVIRTEDSQEALRFVKQ